MKKIVFLLLVSGFVMQSCKNEPQIDISSIKIEGVSLHKDKKWSANKETTEGIKKMNEILDAFSPKSDAAAYLKLKENLETEFTTIFSKCTMKGDAHEQLHNYLKPMIPYFENLSSDNKEIRGKTFNTLRKHVLGYVNYFE